MEDLAVFTALNHSGSFGKNFVKFKNNKYVIYRLRVGPYGEKILPEAVGRGQHFQDLGHSFSPYGPPSRQITYMYNVSRSGWLFPTRVSWLRANKIYKEDNR